MNTESSRDKRLERQIAVVLQYGTWLASCAVAVGLVLPSCAQAVTAGIALFIALPVACVVLMLLRFLRRRDYRIAVIAGLVLMVIAVGLMIGIRSDALIG